MSYVRIGREAHLIGLFVSRGGFCHDVGTEIVLHLKIMHLIFTKVEKMKNVRVNFRNFHTVLSV